MHNKISMWPTFSKCYLTVNHLLACLTVTSKSVYGVTQKYINILHLQLAWKALNPEAQTQCWTTDPFSYRHALKYSCSAWTVDSNCATVKYDKACSWDAWWENEAFQVVEKGNSGVTSWRKSQINYALSDLTSTKQNMCVKLIFVFQKVDFVLVTWTNKTPNTPHPKTSPT